MTTPDAADLLRTLIRIDTSNPPGNESQAAAVVSRLLESAGATVEDHPADPGRSNLVATLPASSGVQAEPPVILISHLDVVPARADEWSHPPFGAETVDGVIYGRGTLDTKQLTVMQVIATLRLALRDRVRRRPVILIAAADEEGGSLRGMSWLSERLPHLFNQPGSVVVSEGGGFPIVAGDKSIYAITSGEKGAAVIRVTVTGEGGHASNPSADPVLGKIAGLVERLARIRFGSVESAIRSEMEKGFEPLGETGPARQLADRLLSYVSEVSVTINRIEAGVRVNVVPSQAEMELEIRFPPGSTRERMLELVSPALDAGGIEWELVSFDPGFTSRTGGAFFDLVRSRLATANPKSALVPILALGRTDGRFFDHTLCDVYGFSPVLEDSSFDRVLTQVHAVDERVSEASVRWGTDLLTDLVQDYVES